MPVLNTPLSLKGPSDIIVFYPGQSLTEQMAAWRERHPDCNLELSFATTHSGIRNALRHAALALLDATADPDQISEGFAQAVAKLGAYSTAVYSETMHEWLELSVRVRGVLLLLGPMTGAQWDGFFERMLSWSGQPRCDGYLTRRPRPKPVRSADVALRDPPAGKRTSAGLRRPKTGVK
jgi:hypothetical protein